MDGPVESPSDHAGAAPAGSKELRLALVCYGGVSLAIYMHGVTKEIHKLVAASRAFDEQPGTNPFPGDRTEHAYFNALRDLADRDGVRTRVVVDVVSGTSAGGINGVFLAKALAHDLSQDALRDLWMDKGVGQLLAAPQHLPMALKYTWLLSNAAIRRLKTRPPLSGSRMCRWLYDALTEMDPAPSAAAPRASLMPEGHPLELFVTATDYYGFARSIPVGTGTAADRSHRHVLTFRWDPSAGVDGFAATASHNAALAFAARATSSFPGAFPPISIGGFQDQFHEEGVSVAGFESDLFRIYDLEGDDPTLTYFVDGGVLDNFPFGHAIDAIRARPADQEVTRRLVYIQPDPGEAPRPPQGKEPGLVGTVWKTLSAIPRNEPIVDDLLDIRRLNERVQTIREVIETSFGGIRARVEEILEAEGGFSPEAPAERIERWQERIRTAAERLTAVGYPTYVRLKLHSVVDELAAAVSRICDFPAATNHAFFVRTLIHAWAKELGLFERAVSPSELQIGFLRSLDVDFRLRRVQFLIAGVNWLYGQDNAPARSELDEAKRRLYAVVTELEGIVSGATVPDALRRDVLVVFDADRTRQTWTSSGWDPALYLKDYAAELDWLREKLQSYLDAELTRLGQMLHRSFVEVAGSWDEDIRTDLVVRYLGFPIWDAVLYPVQSLADAGERDAVEVVRMSPDEATLLEKGGAGSKLKGTGFHHFAAFFKREWRENDYVWGRLDGAELLMGMLLGDPRSPHTGVAMRAVVEEERSLRGASEAFATVARSLGDRSAP